MFINLKEHLIFGGEGVIIPVTHWMKNYDPIRFEMGFFDGYDVPK